MFVASDKAERELDYRPGAVEAALERAVRCGMKRRATWAALRRPSRWPRLRLLRRVTRSTKCRWIRIPVKALFTFALETEFAPWRKLRKFEKCNWGASEVWCTEVDGLSVAVLLTGGWG